MQSMATAWLFTSIQVLAQCHYIARKSMYQPFVDMCACCDKSAAVQALLEATAKGSYGARMPRQQQGGLGPASMARPGVHLPLDARGRGHMLGGQHPRPILTGASLVCSAFGLSERLIGLLALIYWHV